jgi:hypothetical protein
VCRAVHAEGGQHADPVGDGGDRLPLGLRAGGGVQQPHAQTAVPEGAATVRRTGRRGPGRRPR